MLLLLGFLVVKHLESLKLTAVDNNEVKFKVNAWNAKLAETKLK